MKLHELRSEFGEIYTNNLKVIDKVHHEIHDSSSYFLAYSILADDAESFELRIQTPDSETWAHMEIIIQSALAATASLWKDTTKTDVLANRLTPLNRNFNSDNISVLTICHTPGGAQAGSADILEYLGSPTTPGKADVGGGTSSRGEFILEQNSAYLLQLASRSDNNALTLILSWYEEDFNET